MALLVLEYLLFVFVAALGVLQGAAARSGLRGLSFFRRPWKANFLSLFLVVGAFAWFFGSEDRSRPGLEGLQQLGLFSLAVVLALAFTLSLSSFLLRGSGGAIPPERGMEALSGVSYWQLLRRGRDAGGR